MSIVCILCLLVFPFLAGVTVTKIFGTRNRGYFFTYIIGFLFLVLFFIPSLLAALKLDLTLKGLEKIWFAAVILLSAPGLLIFVSECIGKKLPSVNLSIKSLKERAPVFITLLLVWIFSVFLQVPSFANDDTWEIVANTVAHDSIYGYSSFTGKALTAGLPIFNKVYVMPLIYAVLVDFFGIEMTLLAGAVIPTFVLFANTYLTCKLFKKLLPSAALNIFMCAYFCVMAAGTYLPSNGIPVTVGYSVIREGYSGYAFCYGLVLPAFLFLLSEKKRIFAVLTLATASGLVRIDRIFYAFFAPFKWLRSVNLAGKLAVLYIVAVIALILLHHLKKKKYPAFVFLFPSAAIAFVVTELSNLIVEKKKRLVFGLGVAFIIFAACDFMPGKDAESGNIFTYDAREREAVKLLESDACVLSTKDFCSKLRRIDGNKKCILGRDYGSSYLVGLNYEEESEYAPDYSMFAENYALDFSIYGYSDFGEKISLDELFTFARFEGLNAIVIPSERRTEAEDGFAENAGFKFTGEAGGYTVYALKRDGGK